MSLRIVPVLTGVTLAAVAVSANQGGQRPAGSGPTRVIVRAVANGQSVADLKAEDLSIRIDGKPREVKSLDVVTASTGGGTTAAPAAAAAPVASLPPPFATNTGAAAPAASQGGREFLILLDEEGVGPGQEEPVRKAIAKIMSEATEGDRFGYMGLRVGGRRVAPSTNRAAVTEELTKFVGGGLTTETVVDITCRTKRIMGTLLNAMGEAPAGRTLVLITSGLVANPVAIQPIRSRTNSGQDIDTTIPETCQIRTTDLEDFGVAAALSPANMFVVHYPQAMAAMAHQQNGQTGIENLTGVSNAEFVRLTAGAEPSLSRITRETTSYYIATLDEAPTGAMRRIDANVKRDGVKVIARPATGRGRPAPAAASSKGMTPRDMIKGGAAFSEVPLRAAGFVSREGASDMKVVTLFEAVEPGAKLTAASVAVIDEASGKGPQWNARPEDLERPLGVASIKITPGKYRVRVAATTAAGGGTVDFPLDATLIDAGPLKIATMLLGVAGDKGFTPRLQFTPDDEFALGVVEIYGVPKGATVTSQYEITPSESGEPIGKDAGRINNGPTDEVKTLFGGFGIKTLPPGDYLMRVKISVDGKEVGTATRTVRKITGS